MAIRNIVLVGDDTLHKTCKPVTRFDAKLHQLLDDMRDTLAAANGVGLAAPQVGILRRVVIVDDNGTILELINPEIVEVSGSQNDVEGCLSVPGKWGYVERPQTVTVRAQDRNGEEFIATGHDLTARCFCHEIDHLTGHLFTELVTEFVDIDQLEESRETEEE
ncbi:MAG: peptide deformylase [Eubacteriales bacterium]|jgi:peptide deformylase